MADTATAPASATEDLLRRIKMCANLFNKDLTSTNEALLSTHQGGKARTGLDLAYEVTSINNLVAAHARGENTPVERPEGWTKAPEGYSKERALREFDESVQQCCDALAAVPAEKLHAIVATPMGEMPLISFANVVPLHIMYHSGQVNYIQTLNGDDAFHWAEA